MSERTAARDSAPSDERPALRIGERVAAGLLERTLAYARERDYTGWDYVDGMSSRIRRLFPGENRWINLCFQEGIKRAPVNLRPLFLVEQRRNDEGAALFTLANLAAYDRLGEDRYRREALRLADWLVEHRSRGYAGFCVGHQHATQDVVSRRPAGTPGIVSTGYAVRALLAASRFDRHYADVARSAARFLFEDLHYRETADGACIDYHPDDPGDSIVLNANAIGARTLLDLHDRDPTPQYRQRAERILDHVVARQTDLGGWYYTDPPTASHLSMDNHHNGFVLESLLRHREVTGSDRYGGAIDRGLEFLSTRLFESSGAPNWDENKRYPKDVHAAAQGIVTFARAGDLGFASRVLAWTLSTLYDGDGQFHHQKRRYYTKRFTLMRWCQAWMAFALATYVREAEADSETVEREPA